MRLIDADVAAKEFMVLAKEPDYQHEDEDWRSGLYMAEEALYRLPAVDIAEQIFKDLEKAMPTKAQWIPVSTKPGVYAGMKCSLCKAKISYRDFYSGNHNYCHKCGAKMIKES